MVGKDIAFVLVGPSKSCYDVHVEVAGKDQSAVDKRRIPDGASSRIPSRAASSLPHVQVDQALEECGV